MADVATLGQPAIEKADVGTQDQILHSVTSVIGALDKPALVWWSADETAKEAIRVAATLKVRVAEDGPEETYQWLRRARFRAGVGRLSSAALGTVFHHQAEQYALQGTRPTVDDIAETVRANGLKDLAGIDAETAVIGSMLDQFDGWLQRFTPTYQATEVCVYDPRYGVAGTCDGFFTLDGQPLIFDLKTSREQFDARGKQKTPYPEVALQLAAYRWSPLAAVWRPRRTEKWRRRYYLLSPEEQALAVPTPHVDGGVVIHVTPGSCEAFPVHCDETVHRQFLFVLEAYRFVQDTAPTVIGDPLEAPQ